MAWKKTDDLLKKRLNQHGLGPMVEAGIICSHAESLYPGLFRAVSVRDGCFTVEITKANQVSFTLIKGKLQQELNDHAKRHNLKPITRIRLTFEAK